MTRDGVHNDAKERHRLKRATNVAIFEGLSPQGFRRGQSGGSFRNFMRRDLSERVYVELSANGVDATWKDTIDYQPWLNVVHEAVEGLILVSSGGRSYRVSSGTAMRYLTQLVSQRWGEWSVLTDDDVGQVAADMASAVLGPGLAFAQSVETLEGLIKFLIVRPTFSTRQLPAALALARDTVQLETAITRTVLFSTNTFLSDYTNVIAGFAMGLYEELERGLRSEAEYAELYRRDARKSPKARHEEWMNRWPPPTYVDELVHQVSTAATGPAGKHKFVVSQWDSPDVYPYPLFQKELANGIRLELVLVPEHLSPDAPIRLLPLVGVTHLAVQEKYAQARAVSPRLFYLQPYTHLIPLHVACPGSQAVWSAATKELAAAVGLILDTLAERSSDWLQRTTDLDGLVEVLAPLSADSETSLVLAAIYAERGNFAFMQSQLKRTIEQFEQAALTPHEQSLLSDAQSFARYLTLSESGSTGRDR